MFQYLRRPDGSACFPFASHGMSELCAIAPLQLRQAAAAFFAMVHAQDRERVAAAIEHSYQTLSLLEHDYRLQLADGSERWLESKASVQEQADGSRLWHGYVSDVTEWREGLQRLG
jgi:PAS domain-containing protein